MPTDYTFTGGFAQADSIIPAGVQGLDRYAYANNNPVQYTDPTGHMQYEDPYESSNGKCKSGDPSCNWVGKNKGKNGASGEDGRNGRILRVVACDILRNCQPNFGGGPNGGPLGPIGGGSRGGSGVGGSGSGSWGKGGGGDIGNPPAYYGTWNIEFQ